MELLQFEVTNAGTLGEGGPTSVTLPDSITHIGSYAFYHCTCHIFYLIFYKRYMEWPIFLLSDSFME